MATARDLCRKILEASGKVGLRQSIEGSQLEDTLEYLNMELTILNNQDSFKPYDSVFEVTIPSGKDEYTIGSGGDIDLPRPISISWMKVLRSTTYEPMTQTTQKDFSKSSTTTLTGTTPYHFYYESTFPLGVIGFGYTLSESFTYKLGISHEIQQFGLNDEVNLPEGYYPLLLWGTVARIPRIPPSMKAEAKANYAEILATIKSQNTKSLTSRSSFSKGRRYNRHTDVNE